MNQMNALCNRCVPTTLAVAFCVQLLLLAFLSWNTSVNRTEVGHLGAAIYFYETARFDVFHVNPPLTRYFAGLPIRLLTPKYDWKSYSPRPQDRSEWSIGINFINANPPEKIRQCVFLARCSLIPLILLGSYFGYRFATELYGKYAGLVFFTLWTFSPLVLGWGATLCPDVVSAALGIIATYCLWHFLKNPTWWNTTLAGLTLGLLPLAKMTWIIAFPIWLLLWCLWFLPHLRLLRKQATKLLTLFLIALYVINMGYGFDGLFRQLKDYTFISNTLTGSQRTESAHSPKPGNRFENSLLGYLPLPLPAEFVQGIDTQKLDFERGIESYLMGEFSQHGWLTYYGYTILLKEPTGVLVLLLLTLFVTIFVHKPDTTWRNECVVLLPGILVFLFVSSQTGFSLHPRYIIPVLPFLYLWVSKLGQSFIQKRYVLSTITILLLTWILGSSMSWYPHSMSYFNELIGRPSNAPRYLLGSNLDWGQNSYFLRTWYEKHPNCRPFYVGYSGTETLERLGMKDALVIPKELQPGWYAIGVNELYGSSKQYESFQKRQPVDCIGYSIYLYHLADGERWETTEESVNMD